MIGGHDRICRRCVGGDFLPVLLVDDLDGLQFFGGELGVDGGQLLCGEPIELVDDVVELAAQHFGARYLLIGGTAVVPGNVAVEVTRILAEALFAGDASAFFGGDDFDSNGVGGLREGGEILVQGIFVIEFGGIGEGGVADGDDGVDGPAHMVE